ncbi:hypothetical protein RWV98_06555 [Agathobaculum sp. NTUH-O15-33]|uniref:hypothetical protein n=1 Tax=Agathobaculum sp. NTUH-O15-33 TaxID=3079302 RepID=UPI002958B245|nr:hypothetical protein [Agathobaculum sp. NTUH-O15-33]WNX86693.1 hypothetical protein RWV98_06555 [Agathobaculum sp. NTUH-O15-33]
MEHRVKVTVLDKKLFPELQAQYCAVPDSGKCPCYNVGDEFMFYRNDERDDYWHMGAGTLIKSGKPDEGVLLSPWHNALWYRWCSFLLRSMGRN